MTRRPPPARRRSPRIVSARHRMRTILLLTVVVFSVFLAQLVRIQGLDSGAVAAQARAMRTASNVAIPALRGEIVSSDGAVLATSLERVAVVADPQVVCLYGSENAKTCDPTWRPAAIGKAARELAPLVGRSEAELTAKLSQKGRYVILSRSVPPASWSRIADLGIPGVYRDIAESRPVRSYPQGGASAALVGWLQVGERPVGGIEKIADEHLAGVQGKASYETAGDGSILPLGQQTLVPARDGTDVVATIDSNLQWYAQNALANQVAKTQALSGTVIVMDVHSGDLLAVASSPTFDPNRVTTSRGTLDDPAFTDVFEPGSTAKVMTIATALDRGAVKSDTPVVIPNSVHRYHTRFHDSHDHGTELRTVAGTLAESSNVGTLLVSETLKAETLEQGLRAFGVGAVSGVGFPNESAGLFPRAADWNGTQRYTISYGQGVSVTAIQAASVYQALANGGVRVTPRLIAGTRGADGDLVPAPPAASREVVSAKTATEVTRMLEGATSDEGTAPAARIDGYRVAGKTGTADRVDPRTGRYSGKTASFIGFAPADKPELVVAVILQRPVKGYFGGTVAAPVFHDVMQYALQARGIPPTGTKAPKIALQLEKLPTDGLVLKDGHGPAPR